jgi:hydroxyacylglutathione hydrolase
MFFRRFYDDGLAQASYLIGCDATREAVVVDANRDAAQYMAAAEAANLRITCVTETHIHADFVSGSRELARRARAKLLLSAEGGPEWQYAFAEGDGAAMLRDGDAFSVGRVRMDVMHTPGHTPEHLAFLVTDLASSDRPVGFLSGDFVFVGDVGRPDLLERAAKIAGTMEAAAHTLFHSLQRFRELPDFVQLWPGHGAGSACGKALGAMPQSTVGYEKIANWGVTTLDEDAFVREVLAGQPDPPPYFAEMKRINRAGPPMLGEMAGPPRGDPALLTPWLLAGASVVDVRAADSFADSHIPGTLNIPLNKSFSTWAGWLVPYDRDVQLIAGDAEAAARAARALAMIGLDRVTGWHAPDVLERWTRGGRALERVPQMGAAELAARIAKRDITVVDVRADSEWAHGHLPGALHIPLGSLGARIGELPAGRPIVVQCQGGNRSAIAASVLLGHGARDVFNLRGGFSECAREGCAVTRG